MPGAFRLGAECVGLKLFYVLVPLVLQLLTDFMGNMAGLPSTDGQFGQILQDIACFLKGGLAGGRSERSC